EVSTDGRSWTLVADSSDRLQSPAPPDTTGGLVTEGLSATQTAEVRRQEARAQALDQQIATLAAPRKIYCGLFAQPGPSHRLHRGDPMQPREFVRPGALASFGAPLKQEAETPEQQRRLSLARWITDPRHPLTARVLVNRLWQHHFGEGIVSTPSDFGLNGAKPTHPELLDWLASEFVANGWSMKHMHRLMVLCATYRQCSAGNPAGLAADAGSRLLWRYPPRRLEAEPLRDAILAVSGNLDRRMGGPGFDLFEPNTNYVKVYNPKKEFGPPEWKRMIYQSKPRMQLDDTFGQLDCPDAGQIAPKSRSWT